MLIFEQIICALYISGSQMDIRNAQNHEKIYNKILEKYKKGKTISKACTEYKISVSNYYTICKKLGKCSAAKNITVLEGGNIKEKPNSINNDKFIIEANIYDSQNVIDCRNKLASIKERRKRTTA
jgi:hypothetical protein